MGAAIGATAGAAAWAIEGILLGVRAALLAHSANCCRRSAATLAASAKPPTSCVAMKEDTTPCGCVPCGCMP